MGYLIIPGVDSADISMAESAFFESYKWGIISIYTSEAGDVYKRQPVDDKQRAEMQLLEKRFRDMIYTKGKTTDKEVETIRKKYD